jgi:hypothetical protein
MGEGAAIFNCSDNSQIRPLISQIEEWLEEPWEFRVNLHQSGGMEVEDRVPKEPAAGNEKENIPQDGKNVWASWWEINCHGPMFEAGRQNLSQNAEEMEQLPHLKFAYIGNLERKIPWHMMKLERGIISIQKLPDHHGLPMNGGWDLAYDQDIDLFTHRSLSKVWLVSVGLLWFARLEASLHADQMEPGAHFIPNSLPPLPQSFPE